MVNLSRHKGLGFLAFCGFSAPKSIIENFVAAQFIAQDNSGKKVNGAQ
jgi:hypothetical protein